MTLPTGRTGVQIKAVLSVLHKAGHNVAAIERQAENAMRTGRPAAAAYDAAVGQHLKSNPGIKATVERVARLIGKSDDASIARYDHALNAYIAGDEGPVDALAPMMRADMQALAVRDGELSVDDAAAGRVDWAALGVPGFADQGGAGATTVAAPEQPQANVWSNQAGASYSAGFAEDRRQAGHAGSTKAGPATHTSAVHVGRDAWSNQAGASASPRAAEFNSRAERASYGDAAPLASGMAARSAPLIAAGPVGEAI